MNEVGKRLIKSSGANGFGLVARMTEQVLLVPILLSGWSVELYGEWMLLSIIPVYLALSDFGFISAGSNELARRASLESADKVKAFFRDYTSSYLTWSFVLAALFALAAFFSPLRDLLHLTHITSEEARLSFLLLTISALISQNALTLIGGLRALKLFHLGLMTRAVYSFVSVASIAVGVIVYHVGPVGVACIMLTVKVAEYFTMALILTRLSMPPTGNMFRSAQEKEDMGPFFRMGLEFMLMPLGQALVLQGMTLVVGLVMGPLAVAIFTTHRTLTRVTSSVIQIFVAPLTNEAGLLQGEGEKKMLARIVILLSSFTFWMSVSMGGVLYFLGPSIFEIWTHGQVEFHSSLFLILITSAVFEGVWRLVSSVRMGTNRHSPITWSYFFLSAAGVGVAYVLGRFGNLAVLVSPVVIIDFTLALLSIYLTVSFLNVNFRSYLRALVVPPIHQYFELLNRYLKRRG